MSVSLGQSLTELGKIIDRVELAGGEVPDELIPSFAEVTESLKDAIDRRIMLLRNIQTTQAMLAEDIARSQYQKKCLANIAERVKARTLDYMKLNPEIEFKGTKGEFKISKAGGLTAIEYKIQLQSVSHVIDPTDRAKIPEEYVDKITVYVLKKETFESDLRAGNVECPDAAILKEKSEYVRIS